MNARALYRRLPPPVRAAAGRLHWIVMAGLAYLIAPLRLLAFYVRGDRSDRLHLGCGKVRLSGWINADLDPRADLVLDLRLPLPFRADRLSRIYLEHVLEHLSVTQGLFLLRQAHRVLKEGGVIRIAMPDLDDLVDGYAHDWRRFAWLQEPGHQFIQTRAEMLNVAFRWWGHRHLYNAEELQRRLMEAGFRNITLHVHGISPHSDLSGLETRPDSKLVAEAVK